MEDFFLCLNPLLVFRETMTGYVYHSGKPRFFAAFFTIDPVKGFYHLDYPGRNLVFVYTRGDGHMQVFLLIVSQNIDRATSKLDTALKQAAAWHTTCLNLEDQKKYGKQSSFYFLTDFNLLTPGLKIMHLAGIDKYVLSYPDGIKSFDNARAMDEFMTETLGYNEVQLETGHHNVFVPGTKGSSIK